MNRENNFSDEFLNAFVDDQLGADEKGRIYARLNQDDNIKRQVCELRTMHDLVQFAYKDLPVSSAQSLSGGRQSRIGMGVAATVTLVLGLVVGWVLHQPASENTSTATLAQITPVATSTPATTRVASKPTKRTVQAMAPASANKGVGAADNQVTKVLVHYNSGHANDAGQILDDLEGMLKYYRANGQIARVELIVNSEGLDLLRVDTSRHVKRILRLQEQYDNLTFVACQNTIDRLRRETGIVARLLPGVVVIDSGVAQLMRRQHQGWAYIQA